MKQSERKAKPELIPGAPIKLGGETLLVPALTFGQMEKLANKLEKPIGDRLTPEFMSDTLDIIGEAISRNYVGYTKEYLKSVVDLNNARPIIMAIKGESGFITDQVPAEAGE